MSGRISIVMADDHTMVLGALRDRLEAEPSISVVAGVGNAEDAVTETVRHRPQVVLLDIDMPGLGCFEAARTITSRCPDARVIFLSAFTNDRYIEQALAVKASGYVTKSEPLESVIAAIRSAVSGYSYYSPEVQCRIEFDSSGGRLIGEPQTRSSKLTLRERQVLRYIARGLAKKEIAATMHLSAKTVDVHTNNLMNKLSIHKRVGLTRFAIREGLVEA